MGSETKLRDKRLPLRWIAMTTLGWLVGFALVILLSMALESVGGVAQLTVGVGMGAGVGLFQGWVIAPWVTSKWHWFLASTIGMGLPYLLWDFSAGLGFDPLHAMWVCTVAGGVLVGVLQRRLFRPRPPRSGLWVLACTVGWGIPELLLGLDDVGLLSGGWAFLSIAVIFFGGLLLGSVTSAVLPRDLPHSAV